MRRSILAVVLAAVPLVLFGHRWTPAHGAVAGHVCFDPTTFAQLVCTPTPAPTAMPIPIVKTLGVSAAPGFGEDISNYYVTIQSTAACFALDEPIDVYTLGNTGEAVLSPATPGSFPVQSPDHYRVTPDQSGMDVLSLEVWNAAVGPQGLTVKAVWPQEGIEAAAPVVPPSPGTSTPGPTPTSTPALTPTAVPDTATPGTPAPTDTPVTTRPFFVRTCVSPNPTGTAATADVYVETLPGATCSASVTFSNGSTAADLDGVTQTIGSYGTAGFTFTVDQTAAGGTAAVTCLYNGQTGTASADFLVGTPTPTATAGP